MMLRIRPTLLLLLACCLLLATVTIALPSQRRVITRSSTTLFHQRQRQQQRQRRRKVMMRMASKKKSNGTQFMWRRPTSHSASQRFTASSSSSDSPFNHVTAGMTNPSLHIAVDNQVVMHISATSTTTSTSTSTSSSTSKTPPQETSQQDGWWPETTTTTGTSNDAPNTAGWRVMEYRRTIGWGQACYEAVRDKALAWEFDCNNQGILALHQEPSTTKTKTNTKTATPNRNHHRPSLIRHAPSHYGYDVVHTGHNHANDNPSAWHSTTSALSIGDCPRLVTYTKSWLLGCWCVSPVQVVYDWVDQRGPSTTYTSTAYATLKKHALVGEERVTVALRDSGRVDIQLVSYSKAGKWWTKVAFAMVHKMQHRFFSNQLQWLQTVAAQAQTGVEDDHHRATGGGGSMTLSLLAKPMFINAGTYQNLFN